MNSAFVSGFVSGLIAGGGAAVLMIAHIANGPGVSAADREAAEDHGRQCRRLALIDTCLETCFRTYAGEVRREACTAGVLFPKEGPEE